MKKYYHPSEVTITIDKDGKRHAYAKDTGEELIIGSPEKMSKSKRNTVDWFDFLWKDAKSK